MERFPRFRQRVVERRCPLGGPHWEDDPDFDLDLPPPPRGLPAPGRPRRSSGARRRPDGRRRWTAPSRSGTCTSSTATAGGSALITRMHHCIADGIALARVMLSLTDERRPTPGSRATARRGPRAGRRRAAARGHGPRPRGDRAGARGAQRRRDARARGRRDAARAPARRRRTWPATAARRRAGARASCCSPGRTPRPCCKGERASRAGSPGGRRCSLDEIKAIGHGAGATVNDVLVPRVTGGLRDYLRERDSAVDEVRAHGARSTCARSTSRCRATLGNQFGLVCLPLPVGADGPARAARGRQARAWTRSRTRPRARSPTASSGAIGLTPAAVESAAGRPLHAPRARMVHDERPGPEAGRSTSPGRRSAACWSGRRRRAASR